MAAIEKFLQEEP